MAYILWNEARERVVVLFFYIYRFEILRLDKLGEKNAETLSYLRSVQTDATTA